MLQPSVPVVVVTAAILFHLVAAHGKAAARSCGCIMRERDALLAFKKGITHEPSAQLASERPAKDCCQWRGVHCSNRTGHVIQLRLRHYPSGLDLSNSYGVNGMAGLISPSLLALEHLQYLDISWNRLKGPDGRIPEFIGSFRNLRYLNLSVMPLVGTVPPQLNNLSKLQFLDLSGCDMMNFKSGMAWIRHLPSLQYLDLTSVNLSAVDDWPHVMNTLPSLRFLYLSECRLQDANQSLPHLGNNLTRLESLDLSKNFLEYPVASCWFWNLTRLKHIILSWNYLSGQLPDTLEDMTSLQLLDLSYNRIDPFFDYDMFLSSEAPSNENHSYIDGITIMTTNLRNLCNLEILDLTHSLSSGNITELFDSMAQCPCRKLQELRLENNNITGILPKSMGLFYRLVYLQLTLNNITGDLPPEIGTLTNLAHMDLSNNALVHLPPEISMLTNLAYMDLSNNALVHLPSEIGMLSNLTYLDLGLNHLNGLITEKHFANLTSLRVIKLSPNPLEIKVNPEWLPSFRLKDADFQSYRMGPKFPTWLQFQLDIDSLDISNTSIKDTLPDWFWTTFSKATHLNMSNNQINGRLPKNMETMSFTTLYMGSNKLTGEIPPLPRNLSLLDISNNYLSGPLPSNLGAPSLQSLNLHSNNISGNIPQGLCKLENLFFLDLGNNLLEGELHRCFEKIRELSYLRLNNNGFTGNFPSSVRNSSYLEVLDLSWNELSGGLPTWIEDLADLKVLQLSHNKFSGDIPESITKLTQLHHLDLASNNISGALPNHLSKLQGMIRNQTDAELINGWYTSELIFGMYTKGQVLYYNERIVEVVTIDLSSNFLSGGIPEDIVSLGGLINLNLSRNYLRGNIPYSIVAMRSLMSLDLSENKLYGEIPPSLSVLTSLIYLNLSYNNLAGRIPSGTQLDSIYNQHPDIYNGNSGLYDFPLPKNFSSNDVPKHGIPEKTRDSFHIEPFFFGLVSGLIVGFWLVFVTLLFKKSWRVAYFRLFDEMYDKAYVVVVIGWARLTRKTATI